MRQIVLEQPGQFRETFTAPPVAGEGEAFVRVHRVAFAGSQPLLTYPRTLGHELGVEVIGAPPNERKVRRGGRTWQGRPLFRLRRLEVAW